METIKKWIATPGRRLLLSFVLMAAGVLLSALFMPFAVVAFAGLILFLMLGQQAQVDWSAGKQIDCPICKEKTSAQLVTIKSYMYPILPFVGKYLSIPVEEKYYLVCHKCLETHVGENNLSTIMVIAQAGMAHAKEITKQEYTELIL